MRINNNLSALTAFNSLNSTNKSLQKAINSLSTGLRINSAADDAAGFAISEKMRSQISSLNLAMRNSMDGISLLETAEGALGETNSMLQRMRELCVQASNGTLTSQDRQYIQLEIDELRDQIDRIANTTQFNKKRILDGSSGAMWTSSDANLKARINGGLVSIDEFGQKVNHEGNYRIEVSAEPGEAQVQKSAILTTWKTETDYGADAEPEEVTETVRTVEYDTITGIETRLFEETSKEEEPYCIYINGKSYDEPDVVDNFVDSDDVINKNAIEDIRSGWSFENGILTITKNGTYNIVGRTDENGNTIPTTNRIRVADGVDANIFLTDVDINVSYIFK